MSFQDRMGPAREHELAVQQRIREAGYVCEEWGQGLLSARLREAMRPFRTFLRWAPDLAVVGDSIFFVDAKTGRADTSNHDIEQAAVDAHETWSAATRHRVVYVWGDFSVSTLEEVIQDSKPGAFHGFGSGTPFRLYPKALSHPFTDFFPLRVQDGAA